MKVNDRYKQKYHANVPSGWANDPNGMIYHDGKIHFFFQHYPYDSRWGTMHWGHFTSDDFIKWEEQPIALRPDQDYEVICGCCSGNTIEKDGKLYLMYTAAQPERQRQCMAVSLDGIQVLLPGRRQDHRSCQSGQDCGGHLRQSFGRTAAS